MYYRTRTKIGVPSNPCVTLSPKQGLNARPVHLRCLSEHVGCLSWVNRVVSRLWQTFPLWPRKRTHFRYGSFGILAMFAAIRRTTKKVTSLSHYRALAARCSLWVMWFRLPGNAREFFSGLFLYAPAGLHLWPDRPCLQNRNGDLTINSSAAIHKFWLEQRRRQERTLA